MNQELIKGIIVLAVILICIIALIVLLVRKIITKVKGGKTEKKPVSKVKQKTKKEKSTKKKQKSKKIDVPIPNSKKNAIIEDHPTVMPEEDDDSETEFMYTAPKAITIQLISDTTGKVYAADCTDQILVGRKENCDIRITEDKAVSGNHCLLKKIGENVIAVKDLNSSNGTYLNDSKVMRDELITNGDTLEIGRTRYTVRLF